MNCPNCGNTNIQGSTFCIKCGTNLKEVQSSMQRQQVVEPIKQPIAQNGNVGVQLPPNPQVENIQSTYNQSVMTNGGGTQNLNVVSYVIAVLLKPISTFKENKEKLNDSKTSVLLGGIVAIAMTIFHLISTMLSVVRVENYSWYGETSYSWKFENLKEIKYIDVIFKSLLTYVGVIAVIALIFYLGSLLIKKQSNYGKLLGITATALLPFAIGSFLLAPILGMFTFLLSILCTCIGFVYSLYLYYEFINEELSLEGNFKVYFHLASLAVLLLVAYFVLTKVFESAVGIGIGSILG